MKISYNWLKEFIPGIPDPEKLSNILTSVGLEVENVEKFEEIKGNLAGLLVGEVLKCEKHPDADKLKVTEVDTGNGNILQIICGATNVGYRPKSGSSACRLNNISLKRRACYHKKTKIRGIESNGMICAEDEIGIGNNHEGIMILPDHITNRLKCSNLF